MTDPDDPRVRSLVEAAAHESVTAELLAGGDRYSQFSLYDDPFLAHLEPDERPHYLFFNEMKGIGIGDKRDTITPDGGGLTVIGVTDRRTLAVVGRAEGDAVHEVPHTAVTDAEPHHGLLKHRLEVRTAETAYHLWIDASYEKSALAEAAAAIREFATRARLEAGDDEAAPTTADGGAGAGADGPAGDPREAGASDAGGAADAGARTDDGDGEGTGADDPLETLERLAELRDRGVLSDEEFEAKKRDLLERL